MVKEQMTYTQAIDILKQNNFKVVETIEAGSEKVLRLEIFCGSAINYYVDKIQKLLPDFDVKRGNRDYIFIEQNPYKKEYHSESSYIPRNTF